MYLQPIGRDEFIGALKQPDCWDWQTTALHDADGFPVPDPIVQGAALAMYDGRPIKLDDATRSRVDFLLAAAGNAILSRRPLQR